MIRRIGFGSAVIALSTLLFSAGRHADEAAGSTDDAPASACPSCDSGFQSLPSNGRAVDIADWMRHSYAGSDRSHLAQAKGHGLEAFWDFQTVHGGRRILFAKAADLRTHVVRNLEQFHVGERWVFIDFEWLDSSRADAVSYRRFTRQDAGQYLGRWALRNVPTGRTFQAYGPYQSCPDGSTRKFSVANTIRGPVRAPYTTCIVDNRTGQVKQVKALVLESINVSAKGISSREWYWYGKSEDGRETYGLIRWDLYERVGDQGPWKLTAGGCQMNRIVTGEACWPWPVIDALDRGRGCGSIPRPTCP